MEQQWNCTGTGTAGNSLHIFGYSTGLPVRADCILVCTQQIQFWIPATVTFGILYILCTQKGVLRLILGDRLILMYRSWYSSVDLIEFHGQSKSYSSVIFFVFSGIIRPLRAKKNTDRQVPCG